MSVGGGLAGWLTGGFTARCQRCQTLCPLAARADLTHSTVHGTLAWVRPFSCVLSSSRVIPFSSLQNLLFRKQPFNKCTLCESSDLQVCLQNVGCHFGNVDVLLFCSLLNHSQQQINMLLFLQFWKNAFSWLSCPQELSPHFFASLCIKTPPKDCPYQLMPLFPFTLSPLSWDFCLHHSIKTAHQRHRWPHAAKPESTHGPRLLIEAQIRSSVLFDPLSSLGFHTALFGFPHPTGCSFCLLSCFLSPLPPNHLITVDVPRLSPDPLLFSFWVLRL